MSGRQPPRSATWLLKHIGCGPNNEVVIGDLLERYQRGTTNAWYCRQVLLAIIASAVRDISKHKLATICALIAIWPIYWYLGYSMFTVLGYIEKVWPSLEGLPDIVIGSLLMFGIGVVSGWILARLNKSHARSTLLFFSLTMFGSWICYAWTASPDDIGASPYWEAYFWMNTLLQVLGALMGGLVEWRRTISGNLRKLITVLSLPVLLVVFRIALPVSDPPELLAQSRSTAVRPGGLATAVPPSGEPRSGDLWVNPKDGLTYVGIPAGSFRMGCSKGDSECDGNEKNDHDVTLTRGFWMGQTEVTFAAYGKKTSPPRTRDEYSGRAKVGPQYPVFAVTWQDAVDYCSWSLGSQGGLPSEAQWEYAARSTAKDSPRYGPLAEIAWVDSGNRTQTSHEVKQLRPNEWGLYDMLGNVWEWTNDWYARDYPKSPQADPSGPNSGDQRWFFGPTKVVRGGGWVSSGRGARASDRDTDAWPGDRVVDIGFRCVREAIALNK